MGMYDYGARFYDPSISLWTSVDPLTGQMANHGAYNYTFQNPIMFNDPTGMKAEWIDNGDGTYTAEDGDSAWTLHQDSGISPEEANEIVQEQYGANYKGVDGEMKSNIDPGNVIDVCCSEKNSIEQTNLDKQHRDKGLENQIAGKQHIEDSLSTEISNSRKMVETYDGLTNALKYERGIPGTMGASPATIMRSAEHEADSVNNVIKRTEVRRQKDSLQDILIPTVWIPIDRTNN